jgi:hypothetical protein
LGFTPLNSIYTTLNNTQLSDEYADVSVSSSVNVQIAEFSNYSVTGNYVCEIPIDKSFG